MVAQDYEPKCIIIGGKHLHEIALLLTVTVSTTVFCHNWLSHDKFFMFNK